MSGKSGCAEGKPFSRSGLGIGVKYALFAAAATGVNIAAQRLVLLAFSRPDALYLAMAIGTAAGLLLKYGLDKRYIFYFAAENKRENVYKFILYSLLGGLTTAVFWGTELLFDLIFTAEGAKYAGAAVGLCLGYALKYLLDRRFVFR